uniref:Ig-like domain-containing protein n=1 Tax=Periophthalmus magnuspinnatus TaxID=409849 RepID=A0A3B4AH27_9GOBI
DVKISALCAAFVLLFYCLRIRKLKVNDKSPVDITCKIQGSGPTVVWFRVPDKSNLEYIASLSSVNPTVKKEGPVFHFFSTEKISAHILVLKAFNRSADAGLYSCLSQNREMMFGGVTRLQPGEVTGLHKNLILILIMLRPDFALLLLLLPLLLPCVPGVRTRRCPHHYKRKYVSFFYISRLYLYLFTKRSRV